MIERLSVMKLVITIITYLSLTHLIRTVKDNPNVHPLFHSDGGFQYTSPAFVNMLKGHGMTQSMSRVHCCIDNGPMEGFWGIMKCEMYHYGKHYNTKDELIKAINDWIHYLHV
mgnify:CR=1 FL=1